MKIELRRAASYAIWPELSRLGRLNAPLIHQFSVIRPTCSRKENPDPQSNSDGKGDKSSQDWDKAWANFKKQGKKSLFSGFSPNKYVSWNPKRSEYPLSEEVDPIKKTERSNLVLWTSPRFTLGGAIPPVRRTLGDYTAPRVTRFQSAIAPPGIANNTRELKTGLIQMMCNTVKTNGVPPESYCLRLFPFSLSDKASRWLDSHAEDGETLYDAWERYKDVPPSQSKAGIDQGMRTLINQTAGGGLTGVPLDETYAVVEKAAQNYHLWTSDRGNPKDRKGVQDLRQSESTNDIAKLTDTVKMLATEIKSLKTESAMKPSVVAHIGVYCQICGSPSHFANGCPVMGLEGEEGSQEDANYVGQHNQGTGFASGSAPNRWDNPNRNNPNLSYKPQNQAPPSFPTNNNRAVPRTSHEANTTEDKSAAALSNIEAMLARHIADSDRRLQGIEQSIEQITTHGRMVDNQIAQLSSSANREHGRILAVHRRRSPQTSPPLHPVTPPARPIHSSTRNPSSSRSTRSTATPPVASMALVPASPPDQPRPYPTTNSCRFGPEAEHQRRFDTILSTKKCHRMFISSGLDILFNSQEPTYPMLLNEFLATFEIVGSPTKVTHWKFRAGQRYDTMTKAEVCEVLGFPLEGFCGEYSVNERYEFWKLISSFDYYFRSGWSAAGIKEPLWKIVHRLVAMSINSHLEGATVVTNPDLDIMISMHKGVPADFFQLLSGMMSKWGNSLGNKAKGGGLFISLLAESQGKDGQWTQNPKLPDGAKRRRIDRGRRDPNEAQARMASPPRMPAPVQEDQPPHEDVVMDEAREPQVATPAPPPQPPAASQHPSIIEERLTRVEASQSQI
ncbi:unnamed protein product [Rhodiola kirilowii]